MDKSKNNICPRCDQQIDGSGNYRRHVSFVKDCVGVIYVCKRCYEMFENNTTLWAHQARTGKKKCKPFDISEFTPQEQKLRLQYKKGKRKPFEQKVGDYLHNVTGEDDPIRIPRLIRLMELLNDDELPEFLENLYKTQLEHRVKLITVLKAYNDSGKYIKESKRREIIDSILENRKLPEME